MMPFAAERPETLCVTVLHVIHMYIYCIGAENKIVINNINIELHVRHKCVCMHSHASSCVRVHVPNAYTVC